MVFITYYKLLFAVIEMGFTKCQILHITVHKHNLMLSLVYIHIGNYLYKQFKNGKLTGKLSPNLKVQGKDVFNIKNRIQSCDHSGYQILSFAN